MRISRSHHEDKGEISHWIGAAVSAAAILVTRVGHFGTFATPPDATLAVFFLAGMWLRSGWMFALLLAAAALADQIAFARGVSTWCVTSAYVFLIPTYACLWLAGRASRNLAWRRPVDAARGAGLLLIASCAAFAISNGSFFIFSGYFPQMSGADYWRATIRYLPHYVQWAAVYSLAAIFASELLTALPTRMRSFRDMRHSL